MKNIYIIALLLGLSAFSCEKEEATPQSANTLSEETCGSQPATTTYNGVQLTFPTVFTPNNDGMNDVFLIRNFPGANSRKITVHNSSNVKVFEANPYQNDFNKDSNGKELPTGLYRYKLELDSQIYEGSVQLMRKNDDFCLKNCSAVTINVEDPVIQNNICK